MRRDRLVIARAATMCWSGPASAARNGSAVQACPEGPLCPLLEFPEARDERRTSGACHRLITVENSWLDHRGTTANATRELVYRTIKNHWTNRVVLTNCTAHRTACSKTACPPTLARTVPDGRQHACRTGRSPLYDFISQLKRAACFNATQPVQGAFLCIGPEY